MEKKVKDCMQETLEARTMLPLLCEKSQYFGEGASVNPRLAK
jgi:hypothetical protein